MSTSSLTNSALVSSISSVKRSTWPTKKEWARLAGMAMTAPAVVVTGKIPHRMVPRPWWIWVAVILMVIGVLGGWGLKVAAGRASGLYPRAR